MTWVCGECGGLGFKSVGEYQDGTPYGPTCLTCHGEGSLDARVCIECNQELEEGRSLVCQRCAFEIQAEYEEAV